ncbi:interferon-induced GTP-binding Mx-like protein [Labeo rohita]|uniref:Interferon-induced GTP-binding Mx-like protein n=1 Tax=Labeo rohita TaxID=84645 RepID=A0A498LD78_LABRO|nr:interferon-induced GTP-binding Mx-like protein [Labeo rohita]
MHPKVPVKVLEEFILKYAPHRESRSKGLKSCTSGTIELVLETSKSLLMTITAKGTVTRCPLELKLRKLKNGPWSGNISYSGHKEHFDDPLKVDNLIREEIVQNVFRDICYSSFNQYPPLRHIVSKMINDIQSSQEAKVEERIKEFIDIEQLVFTQDKILQEKLNVSDIPQKTGMDSCGENLYGDDDTIFNSKGCALLDTRYLVPDKLILYHEIIYQRFTDYVPMLIILFMLKDAAKILQHQMLELRNGADVVKLLKEDSEQGRRRADLKQRLELLTQAQKLSKRFWY